MTPFPFINKIAMRLFSSPMRSPAILVFGAFVALALTAVNPAPPAPTHTIALDTPQRTYAVVIDYQRILNDSLFRATVTLRPVWTDMRPLWTRRLTDLYISATPQHGNRTIRTGQLISLQARRDGSYQGAGLVPRPRRLHRILFKNSDGVLHAFRIPTVAADEGDDGGEDPPPEDPPEEDPPEDPPEEDPPEDDPPEDDGGCTIPPGCEIVNPWTCECDSGTEDPWAESALQTGPNQVTITL